MRITQQSTFSAADAAAPEPDYNLIADSWRPFADNDDDGGDNTTEVEPDL